MKFVLLLVAIFSILAIGIAIGIVIAIAFAFSICGLMCRKTFKFSIFKFCVTHQILKFEN